MSSINKNHGILNPSIPYAKMSESASLYMSYQNREEEVPQSSNIHTRNPGLFSSTNKKIHIILGDQQAKSQCKEDEVVH